VTFQVHFQNPKWDPDDREIVGPLSENEAIERFENYPWTQEYLARTHKLTRPTFAVHDLDDGRSLIFFQVGADSPAFFISYGKTQIRRFLRVFRRTNVETVHASDVHFSTATAIVRAFCSRDEQRMTELATWRRPD